MTAGAAVLGPLLAVTRRGGSGSTTGWSSPAAVALLPSAPLAHAVAAEWDEQGDEIDPSTIPLFSLAVTVLDRVTPQRAAILDELAA